MKTEHILNTLAHLLVKCDHVISSSNGRHVASGNIVRDSANGVTLADGVKRDKPTRDAFALRNAIRTAATAGEFLADLEAEVVKVKTELAAARSMASKASKVDTKAA